MADHHVARDITYADMARSRPGRLVIRGMETLGGRPGSGPPGTAVSVTGWRGTLQMPPGCPVCQ